MPVKNFRLFLLLVLIVIAACRPHVEQVTEPDPTSTLPAPTAQIPSIIEDGFSSPHPWENIDDYTRFLSSATSDLTELLPQASMYHIAL
ncbi:MAG: hypothetical protein P8046_03825, partial [Anaerolineales bacterium]